MEKSSQIIQKNIYPGPLQEGNYHPTIAEAIDLHYKDKTPFILFDFSKKIDGIPSAIYSFPMEQIDDLVIFDHSNYEYPIGLFNNLRNNTDSVLICFSTILSNFGYNLINDNFIEFNEGVKKLIEVNDDFQLIDFFRVNPDDAWFHFYFNNEAENAIMFWKKFINPMFSSTKVEDSILLLSNLAAYEILAINSPYIIVPFNTNDINNSDIKWISEFVIISIIHNAIENKQDIYIYIIEDKAEIINVPYIYYIATEYYNKGFKGTIHLNIQHSDKRISMQSNPLINSKEKCDIIYQISALMHGIKSVLLIKDTEYRIGISEWANENNFKLLSESEIMNLTEQELKTYLKDLKINKLKLILKLWDKKTILQRMIREEGSQSSCDDQKKEETTEIKYLSQNILTTDTLFGNYSNNNSKYNNEYNSSCDDKNNILAYDYVDGLARCIVNGKFGFIKEDGTYLIEPTFDFALDFCNEFAIVENNNKLSYLNANGELLTDFVFDDISNFQEGFARVRKDWKYNFLKQDGTYLTEFFDDAKDFYEGFALVEKDNNYAFLKHDGTYLTDFIFDCADNFQEGTARVKKENKYAFLKTDGTFLTDFVFDSADNFQEGFAKVNKDGKYAFLKQDGTYLTDFVFDGAENFQEGFARVNKDGKYAFLKQDGTYLTDFTFEFIKGVNIWTYGIFQKGIAKVTSDGKYAFLKQDGTYLTEFFDDAKDFHEGFALVKKDNNYAFLKHDGTYLTDFVFDDADNFQEGFAKVNKDGKYAILKQDGTYLTEFIFKLLFFFPKRGFFALLENFEVTISDNNKIIIGRISNLQQHFNIKILDDNIFAFLTKIKASKGYGQAEQETQYYQVYNRNLTKHKACKLLNQKYNFEKSDIDDFTIYHIVTYPHHPQGCFITTAICDSFNKPDNCEELTTIRHFRDTWLKNQNNGDNIINYYYQVAPLIVHAINKTANSENVYLSIYSDYLVPFYDLIKKNENPKALAVYMNMVENLRIKYLIQNNGN